MIQIFGAEYVLFILCFWTCVICILFFLLLCFSIFNNYIVICFVLDPCSAKLNLLPDQKEIKIFTHKDFIQSKLVLKAFNKPVVHDDKFTIQISDGFNSIIAEIRFFILPKVLLLFLNDSYIFIKSIMKKCIPCIKENFKNKLKNFTTKR